MIFVAYRKSDQGRPLFPEQSSAIPINPSGACSVGICVSHEPTIPQKEPSPLRREQKSNGHVALTRVQHAHPPSVDPPIEHPMLVVIAPYRSSHEFVRFRLQNAYTSPVIELHVSISSAQMSGVLTGDSVGSTVGTEIGRCVGESVGPFVGKFVGPTVGTAVGSTVGNSVVA